MSLSRFTVIPFEGEGIDPAELIGKTLASYVSLSTHPRCLTLNFTDGTRYQIRTSGHDNYDPINDDLAAEIEEGWIEEDVEDDDVCVVEDFTFGDVLYRLDDCLGEARKAALGDRYGTVDGFPEEKTELFEVQACSLGEAREESWDHARYGSETWVTRFVGIGFVLKAKGDFKDARPWAWVHAEEIREDTDGNDGDPTLLEALVYHDVHLVRLRDYVKNKNGEDQSEAGWQEDAFESVFLA